MAKITQLAIVHFSLSGPVAADSAPLLLCGDDTAAAGTRLLSNWGPSQANTPLMQHTIGELRSTWGDDSVGGHLHPETVCWVHSTDNGNGGVTLVLAELVVP